MNQSYHFKKLLYFFKKELACTTSGMKDFAQYQIMPVVTIIYYNHKEYVVSCTSCKLKGGELR